MQTGLVENTAQVQEWLHFPMKVLGNNPNRPFMPVTDIMNVFDPAKNSFLKNGLVKRWLVYDDWLFCGGRMAAFFHNETSAGRIGFFDCLNDKNLSSALFNEAVHWLKTLGCAEITGPVNFGEKDRFWGLLTEGFETKGLYLDNFNPPYYRELFEAFGFYPNDKIISYKATLKDLPDDPLEEASGVDRSPCVVHPFSWEHREALVKDIHSVYKDAFPQSNRLSHITEKDIHHLLDQVRPLLTPENLLVAYLDEMPVGFMMFLNEPMFPGSLGETAVRNLKGFGIATLPGVQGRGIGSALCHHFINQVKQKKLDYNFFLSGINANTQKMHSFLQKFGVTTYKTHQTFTIKI